MQDELISKLISNWKRVRNLTYDLVKAVPAPILNKRVGRPIYDTMAKQIYEMSAMQRTYTDILNNKTPDFSESMSTGFTVKGSGELVKMLKDSDEYFYEAIEEIDDWYAEKYDALGISFSAYNILGMIIEHEIFHQGQFAALGYILKVNFPKSWSKEWLLHTA